MTIRNCRICGYKKLIKIGSLGDIPISDFTEIPFPECKKYPLTLLYCPECTLLQLANNTNRELMYKNYWYESGINQAVVNDLKEIAQYGKGVHIDIACNDGTLLKYSNATVKIGVDPSNIRPEYLDQKDSFINDYWENVFTAKADTITAIACLYDLPDPNKFILNVARHLNDDGVFISQFQPLERMIELNDLGNICHEHLEYYSYKSLVYLFERNGLEIFKVEKNGINGGSYRLFARHFQKPSIQFPEKIYKSKQLKDFFKRIEDNKKKMVEFVKTHRVVGFGASTKAGTIVNYYGIGPDVVVDANPKKKYKFTNWGAIIVDQIPEDTEYLWVFPYGFIDYFIKKEKDYKRAWITSIPEFKIIC